MTTIDEEVEAAAAHYAAGRFDDAIAGYRRALALDPAQRALVAAAVVKNVAAATANYPSRYTRDLEAALDFAMRAAPRASA